VLEVLAESGTGMYLLDDLLWCMNDGALDLGLWNNYLDEMSAGVAHAQWAQLGRDMSRFALLAPGKPGYMAMSRLTHRLLIELRGPVARTGAVTSFVRGLLDVSRPNDIAFAERPALRSRLNWLALCTQFVQQLLPSWRGHTASYFSLGAFRSVVVVDPPDDSKETGRAIYWF
jgi:hypothetical protein